MLRTRRCRGVQNGVWVNCSTHLPSRLTDLCLSQTWERFLDVFVILWTMPCMCAVRWTCLFWWSFSTKFDVRARLWRLADIDASTVSGSSVSSSLVYITTREKLRNFCSLHLKVSSQLIVNYYFELLWLSRRNSKIDRIFNRLTSNHQFM